MVQNIIILPKDLIKKKIAVFHILKGNQACIVLLLLKHFIINLILSYLMTYIII